MVAMPKQNVPALRLEGFSGEWERVSVDEVATRHDNERIPVTQKDRIPGPTPYYGANGIQDYVRGFTHEGPLVLVAEDGANDLSNYPVQYVTGYAWVNNHAHALRCKPKTADDYFLKVALSHSDIKSLLVGGGRAKLNAAQLMQISFCKPTLEEQQAIGAIFTNLDAAINQHTLKHKALQQSKTALMQRMFPQEGQTVPELRLKGFSGEWGSAPLQQLASLFTDGDWIESKDQSTEGIRLLQTGNVGIGTFVQKSATQKWISEETFKRLRCQEVLPGDILISRLPDPAGRACIVPMMPYRLITAVDCTIVRLSEENDADYLVAYLGNPSYFEHIDTLLAGGTRQRVSRSQLAAIEVPVPPTLEEQQAIGAVFTNLDQLIAAEAQYIASLKQAKTALLQRMFI